MDERLRGQQHSVFCVLFFFFSNQKRVPQKRKNLQENIKSNSLSSCHLSVKGEPKL